MSSGDLGSAGEFGLIAKILAATTVGEGVEIGIGDDAALVTLASGRALISTDMAVEGVHFRTDWSSAYEIGLKCAAANLADIAAMGGVTRAIVVGLAAPSTLAIEWALELAAGLRDECAAEGASVVGGDTVRSETITISITAIGECERPVTRAGAQVGDVVYLLGRTGASAAGLEILRRGLTLATELVELHRVPTPPYELAREFARAGATSMCDVSDGLIADLGHIADASGVTIEIDVSTLDISHLIDAAKQLNIDPLIWALTGGEDHHFVGTMPAGIQVPQGATPIGRVMDRESESVRVPGVKISPFGHDHFAS